LTCGRRLRHRDHLAQTTLPILKPATAPANRARPLDQRRVWREVGRVEHAVCDREQRETEPGVRRLRRTAKPLPLSRAHVTLRRERVKDDAPPGRKERNERVVKL